MIDDEPSLDDGGLTVFYWHEERDLEADGTWWLDDLEWPDEEPHRDVGEGQRDELMPGP